MADGEQMTLPGVACTHPARHDNHMPVSCEAIMAAGPVRRGERHSCLSLFTGAGGLDAGLESTGRFELLGCLEIEPDFCDTLRQNRDAGRLGAGSMSIFQEDIRSFPPERMMKELDLSPGDLDLLAGGPPCQPFSTAGRRRSVSDPRGDVLWDFLSYVVELRPKFFLMENVRGLISAALRHRPIALRPNKGGHALDSDEQPGSVVAKWMEDLLRLTGNEYRVDCFEVNAVNYGAPQLRERVLFIGNRLGRTVNFPAPTHGPLEVLAHDPATVLMPFRTLRDAIGELHEEKPVLLDFSERKKRYLAMVPPGGNWRALPVEVQQESMGKAWLAKGGRSGWWRRLSWDLPCPTLVTMPNHAGTSMCHPSQVRVLSIAEYAAIQEFPPGWTFAGSIQTKYAQAGNAVPSRLGAVAGQVIARSLASTARDEAPASEPFRQVYLSSHVRTRKWFKAGRTYIWDDDSDSNPRYYG